MYKSGKTRRSAFPTQCLGNKTKERIMAFMKGISHVRKEEVQTEVKTGYNDLLVEDRIDIMKNAWMSYT